MNPAKTLATPFIILLAAGLNAFAAGPTAKAKLPADLTGPWQLFVDDSLIAEKRGLTRVYHAFEKDSRNPILVADQPWEGKAVYLYGTVLPAESGPGYRMWYHAATPAGGYLNLYATSPDGIRWEKPALGLWDYAGSRQNNLLVHRTDKDHAPQVIATPWEKDPQRRYKLITFDYGDTPPNNLIGGYYGATSADGIHWRDVSRNPLISDPGDVGNFIWDARQKRYVGYPKIFAPVNGYRRRSIGYTATADFESWPRPELILVPDTVDDRWVTQDKQRTDFYGLSAFPYESGHIGILWIFRITDGGSVGPVYGELVSSRDGIIWHRQEGERPPILPLGPPGSWDGGMLYTPNHPLVEGERIKLYYGGFDLPHSTKNATAGIGLATLRKDGFASLDAGIEAGSVTTVPLRNLRGELRVNADLKEGSIRAELVDQHGQVVPGYGQGECIPVTGDGVDLPVRWQNHAQLPRRAGEFQLRFFFSRGSLYSFRAGEDVALVEKPRPDLVLTFEEAPGPHSFVLRGAAQVKTDPDSGSKALALATAGDVADLPGTRHLGREFTLAIRTQVSAPHQARLFSTYRGVGDPVTGELLFDVNPGAGVIRFIVNGQKIQSRPHHLNDRASHHYAATFADGEVVLYLDGVRIGEGRIRPGSAHLVSDGTVSDHFGPPSTRSVVGVHLATDLRLGEDQGGRFMPRPRTEAFDLPTEQLAGSVDDVVVAWRVLPPDEIKRLSQK